MTTDITPSIPQDWCHRTQCRTCGKITWAGCGRHIESALRGVPDEDLCKCEKPDKGNAGENTYIIEQWTIFNDYYSGMFHRDSLLEYYEPALYDVPGEIQTLSRSNVLRGYQDDTLPMINHYVRQRLIGQGRHGRVWLCYKVNPKLPQNHPSRRLPVALKEISRSMTQEDKHQLLRENARNPLPMTGHTPLVDKPIAEMRIRKEIAIMKKCRHPHVVRLLEVIDDRMESRIYLVMEYQAGGEVKWRYADYAPALTIDQTRRIMRDVILGVEYLHFQGIIHRDIKPANLLWSADRRVVKIADFGTSHFSYALRQSIAEQYGVPAVQDPLFRDDSGLLKTGVGTPAFLAPELLWGFRETDDKDESPPIGKAIDVWCLGVTLFCLLFGGIPFIPPDNGNQGPYSQFQKFSAIANQDFEVYDTMGADHVTTGGRHPSDDQSESYHALALLDHILVKDPRSRISLDELKKAQWFLRDLPNPERWIKYTSPARIEVNDDDTSTAISSVRFEWRWGGGAGSISRGFSTLFKVVRKQRSRDEISLHAESSDDRQSEVSLSPLPSNKSSTALAIPGRLRGKQRRSSDSTRSRSPLASLKFPHTRQSHSVRPPDSLMASPDGSEVFPNQHDRSAARRFLTPWKNLSRSSASVSSPTSPAVDNGEASTSVPSGCRRMHTLPGRASLAVGEGLRDHANAVSTIPPPSSDLTLAKRASSWGDRPILDLDGSDSDDHKLDATVVEVGAGGVQTRSGSGQHRPFGVSLEELGTCGSEMSYGADWVRQNHASPEQRRSDEEDFSDDDDGPLTFSRARRKVSDESSSEDSSDGSSIEFAN